MRLSRIAASCALAALLVSPWAFAQEEPSTSDPAPAPAAANVPAAEEKPLPFVEGATVYVSDQNKIWTRSGPGEGYRVTGSRPIGEALTFVQYSTRGSYSKLEKDGETFWMLTETLQKEPCGPAMEAILQEKIDKLQYELDNYDSTLSRQLDEAQKELQRLTTENTELQASISNKDALLEELDAKYRDASDRLQTRDLDMQMRWWLQGAMIAFGGAIVGVLFIYIPRPRRKQKHDRY